MADSTGSVIMTILGSSVLTLGSSSSNDQFAGPGTATFTNGSAGVSGSGTSFLTSFGTKSANGSITSSGGSVTGTGTTFTTQVAVGDLIGNATSGYWQVTAIASDTSLTIVSTPGTPFSTSLFTIIENPTIGGTSGGFYQVSAIASNTALTLSNTFVPATQTGVAYTIGGYAAKSTMPFANTSFTNIFVGQGLSGTTIYQSTQRTKPFGLTGYNTYFRRIGVILANSSSICPFSQYDNGSSRKYQFEITNSNAQFGNRLLNGGTQTTWTSVSAANMVPPSATAVIIACSLVGLAGAQIFSQRGVVTGDGTTSRNTLATDAYAPDDATVVTCACDGAQAIEYINSSNSLSSFLDLAGFSEEL